MPPAGAWEGNRVETPVRTLELIRTPVAKAAMLVRRPVAEVFEAFVDPGKTSRFWFTWGSGRLEPGARVGWEWEMYGVSVDVAVKAVEPNIAKRAGKMPLVVQGLWGESGWETERWRPTRTPAVAKRLAGLIEEEGGVIGKIKV
jgi:hypothetical protein